MTNRWPFELPSMKSSMPEMLGPSVCCTRLASEYVAIERTFAFALQFWPSMRLIFGSVRCSSRHRRSSSVEPRLPAARIRARRALLRESAALAVDAVEDDPIPRVPRLDPPDQCSGRTSAPFCSARGM